MNTRKSQCRRRSFLKTLLLTIGASTLLGAKSARIEDIQHEIIAGEKSKGYRLTPHIRKYYQTLYR